MDQQRLENSVQKHLQAGAMKHLWLWNVLKVIVTLQDQSLGSCVKLTHYNIKSTLSEFILSQVVKQTLCRLWLLKETKKSICFINGVNGFFKAKMQIRNKLFFPHWLRSKTTPQLSQKELGLIQCKMHEPVSKNKIGITFTATTFIPGK